LKGQVQTLRDLPDLVAEPPEIIEIPAMIDLS
jgi:hypothetical protein